jgi:alpha-beta hydrolase superfamily lysophospholipase
MSLFAMSPRVEAKVTKTVTDYQPELGIPLTEWQDDSRRPRAIAIAIHGLVLHGGVYDAMATQLAGQGIRVVAPDLRGYGHWVESPARIDKRKACINYKQSNADMVALTRCLKTEYPNIPLYIIGESLGADIALHVASECPQLVDGLVLAAPSVKHRWFVSDLVKNAPLGLSMPFKQIDLSCHIQKYFSDDSAITEATVDDPLVRKRMSPVELLLTEQEASKCLKYAKKVSAETPVLVMQGGGDLMLKSEAVSELLATLPSKDQKLEWFAQRGHLLLETPLVYADTMAVVSTWINQHVNERVTASQPLVAVAGSNH